MDGHRAFSWNNVYLKWLRLLPFLFVFIFNNSILVPALLFQKKKLLYSLGLLIAIVVVIYLNTFTQNLHEHLFVGQDIPDFKLLDEDFLPDMPPPEQIRQGIPKPFSRVLSDNIIISLLVVGFNTAIKFSFLWQKQNQLNEKREKEYLQNELSFLRQQISPHFFMNTLNNIHVLVDVDKFEAKNAIINLSKLMRHMLKESENKNISIKDEIDFIKSYINLMKIRFSKKVKLSINLPESVPDKNIPSLLFISLLENAFKHGISYQKNSFISILMEIKSENLRFSVENSKHPEKENNKGLGIGLKNTRKRLELLFGSEYSFDISESDTVFKVDLTIPLIDD